MKLYVISTKYQPLVNVNYMDSIPVSKKSVSDKDLQATFMASMSDTLISCTNKEDADFIIRGLLKRNGFSSEFLDKGVTLFAVPVIYTVEVDNAKLPAESKLTADDLINYADTTTIPLYHKGSRDDNDIRQNVTLFPHPIMIRKLKGLSFENVVNAEYLQSDASSYVSTNFKLDYSLQILSGFIAAIGIAAVAVAFAVLNAATLGTAGLVVAAIGATALILGGVGLFKFAPVSKHNSSIENLSPANEPALA